MSTATSQSGRPPYVLGIDLGTSSCKVCAVDASGRHIGARSAGYPTLTPRAGWAEQDPRRWVPAAIEATRRLFSDNPVPPDQVGGICLSSAAHIPVLLDAGGNPLRNAILWYDQRSLDEVEELKSQRGEEIFRLSHNSVSPTWTLPQLLWVRRQEPEVWVQGPPGGSFQGHPVPVAHGPLDDRSRHRPVLHAPGRPYRRLVRAVAGAAWADGRGAAPGASFHGPGRLAGGGCSPGPGNPLRRAGDQRDPGQRGRTYGPGWCGPATACCGWPRREGFTWCWRRPTLTPGSSATRIRCLRSGTLKPEPIPALRPSSGCSGASAPVVRDLPGVGPGCGSRAAGGRGALFPPLPFGRALPLLGRPAAGQLYGSHFRPPTRALRSGRLRGHGLFLAGRAAGAG